jgi:hypothetical protein
VNAVTVRAPRTSKQPVSPDFGARDLQKLVASDLQKLVASDDHLLRRWERLAQEPRA